MHMLTVVRQVHECSPVGMRMGRFQTEGLSLKYAVELCSPSLCRDSHLRLSDAAQRHACMWGCMRGLPCAPEGMLVSPEAVRCALALPLLPACGVPGGPRMICTHMHAH